MGSFEKLLDLLIQEEKININESSVVVEFFSGCNTTAAEVISKYKPNYYANSNSPKIFNPAFSSRQGYYFPPEIDEMEIKPLFCDALDVDYYVKRYDIALFYCSFEVIKSWSSQSSFSPNPTRTLIEKIYKSLNKNGALLMFEKNEYWSNRAKKTLKKIQKHGYVEFRKIDLLSSPSSEEGLLYALK